MNQHLKKVALILLGSQLRTHYRIRKIANNSRLTILNLHRVCSDDGSSYKPLEPNRFENLLCYLIKNFRLTTFGELDQIRMETFKSSNKPLLIISFDDGYKDFIEVAVPILFKYKVRVNQNLIPQCTEDGYPPLNVCVQDFVGKSTEKQLKQLRVPGLLIEGDIGNRVFLGLRISKHLKNQPMSEQFKLKEIIMNQINSFSEFRATPMMSLSDIAQCMEFHELGAHSYSHASMEFETDDYLMNDLLQCKHWFSKRLSYTVEIYAFPNGSYKNHQIELVRNAGYRQILLVSDRFSSIDTDLHCRFGFYAESDSEMRFRLAGGFCKI